jgi:ADP-ribose pyrophosphatase
MTDTQIVHTNPWFSISLREEADARWFRVERPDSAMIVGTAPDGRLLLIRGLRDTTGVDAFLEFPCGAVEPGESPEEAAVRETVEETGYAAEGVERIGSFVESPGISAAVCHVFTADVVPRGAADLEPGEDWEVLLLSRGDLVDGVRRGQVVDAGTLSALALLQSLDH